MSLGVVEVTFNKVGTWIKTFIFVLSGDIITRRLEESNRFSILIDIVF